MCGIAGALDRQGRREFPIPRLLAMTAAIAHRGPDDEQFHAEPGVILGARRLSIVDLAGGRQPIPNEDGSIWVAFNGELFEYPELRRELLDNGHALKTRCDTEAWVHLYEDHGEDMFARARGQFAVSLWDRKNETLILGRDRVGICPLYYAESDGWLLWGSEVKAILSSGMVPIRPDPRGIDHLFSFFCAPTGRSYFEGIKSLPPGHYLKARGGKLTVHRYWDLDFPDMGQERRLDDPAPMVDELEALLRQSVERRLRGDVPVVSYISGGLDSTVVLGLSSRHRGEAVPSFTIGFDNAGPDERTQSAESAAALGSKLTTVTLSSPEIAASYPELVLAAEGPVMDTSCAALMKLARSVHDRGFKVALTGEGADEALAGYVWFKTQALRDGIGRRIGNGLPLLARRFLLAAVGGGPTHRAPLLGIGGVRTAQQDLYDLIGQARPILYTPGMWESLGDHNPYDDLDINADRMARWHPMNQSLYVGYKVMLAGLLMIAKGDRISMHSSVETRYPFLDDDVIRFCSEIAPEYKLRGRTEKWILRQVATRTLPAAIANRPKTMFRSKFSNTFLGPGHPKWVDQLISAESLRRSGYFDAEIVRRERMKQLALPRITARRFVMDIALTCVVATQLWHHLFFGGLCDLPTWTPPTFDDHAASTNGQVEAPGASLI